MNEIKRSVIIPCYNQQDLVTKAIDSIPKRDDIEIIVIDDGSLDYTWDNLLEYRKKQLQQLQEQVKTKEKIKKLTEENKTITFENLASTDFDDDFF